MAKLRAQKYEQLAKSIVEHNFNATKAYQSVYPNAKYETAKANVSAILTKHNEVLTRVQEIANEKGLTIEAMVDDLNECRTATKPIIHNKKLVDYPDYATRHAVAITGLKIHGVLSEQSNTNIDARSVNISLDSKDIERLSGIVERMQALRSNLASKTISGVPPTDGEGVLPL